SKISPLWDVLQASYHVLNNTNPKLTEHCWLCYDIRPPFYEAIGTVGNPRKANGMNTTQCLWKEEAGHKQGMTMSQVSGKG
ncbi:ENV2 protein, partial [Nyctibius bracteatus]|nr:ENV2 protein [Nyctibius bracteatus]